MTHDFRFAVEPVLRHRARYGSETPEHLAGYGCWLAWHLPRRAGRGAATLLLAAALVAGGAEAARGQDHPDLRATMGEPVMIDPTEMARLRDQHAVEQAADTLAQKVVAAGWLSSWIEHHDGSLPTVFVLPLEQGAQPEFDQAPFNARLLAQLAASPRLRAREGAWCSSHEPEAVTGGTGCPMRLQRTLQQSLQQGAIFVVVPEVTVRTRTIGGRQVKIVRLSIKVRETGLGEVVLPEKPFNPLT